MTTNTTTKRDYYETLGVERTATTEEISAAYKKLALKHHPDRHANKTEEEKEKHADLFKSAVEAHEVLSDREKRSAYDMYGHAGVGAAGATSDAAAQAMFEAMFMGGGGGGGAPKKRRIIGGALFVDASHRQFFQRSWEADDIDKMKDEMRQGLPDDNIQSQGPADGSAAYVTTTTVPHGAWEVRLVETDCDTGTITVTLCAETEKHADDEAPQARCERTFTLPADADVDAADVALDEAGVLSLTVPSKSAAAHVDEAADSDSLASDAMTVEHLELPMDVAAPSKADEEPEPELFVVGEDLTASAPKAATNRAARRRAKHDGLKAGFLIGNGKPRRSKPMRKEHSQEPAPQRELKQQVPLPHVERQAACRSPISVRENLDVDAAMRAQVDQLLQGM